MRLKEQALGYANSDGTKPARFKPPDELLTFLVCRAAPTRHSPGRGIIMQSVNCVGSSSGGSEVLDRRASAVIASSSAF